MTRTLARVLLLGHWLLAVAAPAHALQGGLRLLIEATPTGPRPLAVWPGANLDGRAHPGTDVCLRGLAIDRCVPLQTLRHLAPRFVGEPPVQAPSRKLAVLSLDPGQSAPFQSLRKDFSLRASGLSSAWRDPAAPVAKGVLYPLHTGGTAAAAVDLVIVGDGFTALEEAAFVAYARAAAQDLLGQPPYAEHATLFNVHALFVASAESGADHPARQHEVDTAFATTYGYAGIERLAVADDAAVLVAVGAALPAFDLAVVLVNDGAYGGSGGPVPVASLHRNAIAILRHELGHNLAQLADEYTAPYPGFPLGDAEPNVASAAHLTPLKWQAWVLPQTPVPTPPEHATGDHTPLGAYEGARYQATGMFRPAPHCLMRSLDKAMCPVCAEALALALAAATQTVRASQPPGAEVSCQLPDCPTFSLTLAALPHLRVRWWRDGKLLAEGATFQPGAGHIGSYLLVAEVEDRTPTVRSDPQGVLRESRAWQVQVEPAHVPEVAPSPAGCGAGPGAGPDATMAAALVLLAFAYRRRKPARLQENP